MLDDLRHVQDVAEIAALLDHAHQWGTGPAQTDTRDETGDATTDDHDHDIDLVAWQSLLEHRFDAPLQVRAGNRRMVAPWRARVRRRSVFSWRRRRSFASIIRTSRSLVFSPIAAVDQVAKCSGSGREGLE
ncbi:hypothetical protein [Streptomyces sp. NPDC057257]|uniref:hypothetical protein n=1 Tax=Streptomyces sp. NPDC057257 TaxID=3346071 RepID=UPI00363365C1